MRKLMLCLALAACDSPTEPETCYIVHEFDANGEIVNEYRTDEEPDGTLPDGIAGAIYWPCEGT